MQTTSHGLCDNALPAGLRADAVSTALRTRRLRSVESNGVVLNLFDSFARR
jgi:hypothetical protein